MYIFKIGSCRFCPFQMRNDVHEYECWADDDYLVTNEDIKNSNNELPSNCPLRKHEVRIVKKSE